ncbi:hypothetical protein LOTGIDRAFT_175350 [Lottia gigantea]|uniref:Uncharacterized protein n=1 Tax=Lottia gigantea TaxID=225164 RepID=V3ZTD2_LOTGI|nr:hypothetical protein LOTGIDRAFT_175350 [Lottia gigantea]ESO94708.1 hypothetical protein LOTGIDRAFT_175350 [Lottia gigantea]
MVQDVKLHSFHFILHEIKEKCRPLAERGVLVERDISSRLDILVTPIIQEAKLVNRNRKYSYNGFRCGGLCTMLYGCPEVTNWSVLEGDVDMKANKDQYFAVQFKYSDDPRGLVNMIEEWNVKWSGRTPDPNLPEPLLRENVVLIGPNDVGEVTNGNLGERIVHQFEQHEQVRCTPDDVSKMKQFLEHKRAKEEFTWKVIKSTTITTAKGVKFGLGLSSFNLAAQYVVANGFAYAGPGATVVKAAGPVVMVGIFLKQSYDVVSAWKNGDLTTTEAAGSLMGGPAGLFVGVGLAIAIGVGDHFRGDKLWSLCFKEDEEEQAALIIKKIKEN